jgi:hypothetical protein
VPLLCIDRLKHAFIFFPSFMFSDVNWNSVIYLIINILMSLVACTHTKDNYFMC